VPIGWRRLTLVHVSVRGWPSSTRTHSSEFDIAVHSIERIRCDEK
jgi:hypothetical protein